VEQKPKSRWRPTKDQVVGAIKIATVLIAVLIASISIWALFEGGYVREAIGILIGIVVLLTLILIRIGYRYEWTGFGRTTHPKSETQEVQPRKTLWDWLGLLIVPLVLAVGGFVFTIQQDARQQQIENQRAAVERDTVEQRAQDAALQAYLDQMGELMLEKDLRDSEEDSEARTLARARTLTVLGRLGPDRKRSVVRFLYESDLIQKGNPIVDLGTADLSDADLSLDNLSSADLSNANLEDANLKTTTLNNANLTNAELSDADLSNAELSDADLRFADLSRADLSSNADLSDADLSSADLSSADLSGATLHGADLSYAGLTEADLSQADLTNAQGVSKRKLEEQYVRLENTIMPDGSKHD
jgi:uncharacterized protein YjbI with pentapeptide repeats